MLAQSSTRTAALSHYNPSIRNHEFSPIMPANGITSLFWWYDLLEHNARYKSSLFPYSTAEHPVERLK